MTNIIRPWDPLIEHYISNETLSEMLAVPDLVVKSYALGVLGNRLSLLPLPMFNQIVPIDSHL